MIIPISHFPPPTLPASPCHGPFPIPCLFFLSGLLSLISVAHKFMGMGHPLEHGKATSGSILRRERIFLPSRALGSGMWGVRMGSGSGCWRVPSERGPIGLSIWHFLLSNKDVYMSFVADDPSCGADVGNYLSKFSPATHLHSSQHCSRLVPLVRSSMSPDPAESLRRSNCTSPQRDQHAQWIVLY